VSRALVTGATGMLGACVVERLLREGWSVRALVRERSTARWLDLLGAQAVVGDLTDPDSLSAAAQGCRAIFNAAAAIGPGSEHETFQRVNVTGTAHVIAAAAVAGARLVHVSSTSVFGRHRYRSAPIDESAPLPSPPAADAYGRSKQDGERLVLDAHARGRVWAAVVRLPVMYGRRDRQFAPRIAPFLERGLFPLIGGGDTTLALVCADGVAGGAIRAAMTDRAGGHVYHLTNDFGRPVLTPRVPMAVGRAAFKALSFAVVAAGRRDLAPHTEGLLDMLTRDNPFTSERARRELGWAPEVKPAEGVADAFRWWKRRR
jgi:nucleoside-diphosphate-sugar epimerase